MKLIISGKIKVTYFSVVSKMIRSDTKDVKQKYFTHYFSKGSGFILQCLQEGKSSHKATYSLTFCMWYWELTLGHAKQVICHWATFQQRPTFSTMFWKSSMGLMKIEWKVKESLILICLLPFSSLWQNSQENRLLEKTSANQWFLFLFVFKV